MKAKTHEKLTEIVAEIYSTATNKKQHTIRVYYEKSRKRDIVIVRQIVMTILSKYYPFRSISLAKNAGYYFKNHATVLHAIKTVSNLCDTDPYINKIYLDCLSRYHEEIVPLIVHDLFTDFSSYNSNYTENEYNKKKLLELTLIAWGEVLNADDFIKLETVLKSAVKHIKT